MHSDQKPNSSHNCLPRLARVSRWCSSCVAPDSQSSLHRGAEAHGHAVPTACCTAPARDTRTWWTAVLPSPPYAPRGLETAFRVSVSGPLSDKAFTYTCAWPSLSQKWNGTWKPVPWNGALISLLPI